MRVEQWKVTANKPWTDDGSCLKLPFFYLNHFCLEPQRHDAPLRILELR